jgi:hypothetical protein
MSDHAASDAGHGASAADDADALREREERDRDVELIASRLGLPVGTALFVVAAGVTVGLLGLGLLAWVPVGFLLALHGLAIARVSRSVVNREAEPLGSVSR